jgi:hypothetical protein
MQCHRCTTLKHQSINLFYKTDNIKRGKRLLCCSKVDKNLHKCMNDWNTSSACWFNICKGIVLMRTTNINETCTVINSVKLKLFFTFQRQIKARK